MKPIEYRNEQISPEVDDFKLACTFAADMDGRSSPGNVVHTYAQWIATLREYYVEVGRELGRGDVKPTPSYEQAGTGYDSGAVGYELQGRKTKPD